MCAVMLGHAELAYKNLVLLNRVFHRNFVIRTLRQTKRRDFVIDGVRQVYNRPKPAGQDGLRPPLLCEQKQCQSERTSDNKSLYFHLLTGLIRLKQTLRSQMRALVLRVLKTF